MRASSVPINIKNAGRVILVLAEGTSNTLTDRNSYTYEVVADEELKATIFSKRDMTPTGEGSLTVNGKFADAVVTEDGLIVKSGSGW